MAEGLITAKEARTKTELNDKIFKNEIEAINASITWCAENGDSEVPWTDNNISESITARIIAALQENGFKVESTEAEHNYKISW